MNEAFYELPEEKQRRIINAGFEVFSQNEYKRASTEEIAACGGISKGLLFYYFHNKKTFYLYLFEKALAIIMEGVVNERYESITDFFELCEYAAIRKQQMLEKLPYLMDFLIRAFYSQREEVSDELNSRMMQLTAPHFTDYLKNIDRSKFKEDADPEELLRMLSWMGDGYLHESRRKGSQVDVGDFIVHYRKWAAIVRKAAYREEYNT